MKLNLSKQEFEELYYDKDLSRKNICDKLNVSTTTLKNYRKKFGLLPREFRCYFHYKNIPNLNPSSSLSYILGIMLGDGFTQIVQKHNNGHKWGVHYIFRLRTTDRIFAYNFMVALKNIEVTSNLREEKRKEKEPVWIGTTYSKKLVQWYRSLSLKDIEILVSDYDIDFLRGFYESEGWLHRGTVLDKRQPTKCKFHVSQTLAMSNYKRETLELMQKIFLKIGYELKIYDRKDTPEHILHTNKKDSVNKLIKILDPCIKKGELRRVEANG